MEMAHIPVLTQELLDLLDVRADSRAVDCTFGSGGHARAVGAELGPQGVLVACDQDPIAEEYYLDLRADLVCRSRFFAGNFADTLAELLENGFKATHIYMDLGLSSMQIDTPDRGFSYSYDAPLDMRMDPCQPLTAADILNTWAEAELTGLFGRYGEERYSRRIARAVVNRRASSPYTRTAELVDTIKSAIPTPARFGAGNPARRVFQALRIEVNDELNSLKRALPQAFSLLEPGGVMAVISFQSLEDRLVKEFFVGKARACKCPPEFPVCVCGGRSTGEVLTSKAVIPGPRELELNPRSSSAKLRALRRL
ncbi:MAG: 16S rRNA (cytosine(1402)-N(4))-methyltransferase [Actinobacteria bacterium RBG_16_64_13]|nr:MAG: 16S rRNA (cytosine(1402)-N(4))-methyltransferase [Actinobacteria bacterium RBG_16_64_13]